MTNNFGTGDGAESFELDEKSTFEFDGDMGLMQLQTEMYAIDLKPWRFGRFVKRHQVENILLLVSIELNNLNKLVL